MGKEKGQSEGGGRKTIYENSFSGFREFEVCPVSQILVPSSCSMTWWKMSLGLEGKEKMEKTNLTGKGAFSPLAVTMAVRAQHALGATPNPRHTDT